MGGGPSTWRSIGPGHRAGQRGERLPPAVRETVKLLCNVVFRRSVPILRPPEQKVGRRGFARVPRLMQILGDPGVHVLGLLVTLLLYWISQREG